MKTSKGLIALYLVVVIQPNLAVAAGETPNFSVELGQRMTCRPSPEWRVNNGPRQQNCLGFDLGYSISRDPWIQVYAGVLPAGFGIRYRYNELTFVEFRANRSGEFFSVNFSHKF